MRFIPFALLLGGGLAACADQTAPNPPVAAPDQNPEVELSLVGDLLGRSALSGGALTVFDASADAFSLPAPNLAGLRLARHVEGDQAFEAEFVAPELGPVFDNVSCESCHLGDGRGRPPYPGEQFESMLFRSSIPGLGPHGGPNPIPGGLGGQLQLRGTGILPDAQAVISYVEVHGLFGDGTPFSLQAPTYTLTGLRQPLPANTLISPRVAPAVVGLGLLEAVPEAQVLGIAVAQSALGRVSGRPNFVWNEVTQHYALGRFGWKANNPSLVQQTAGAYNGDMGITTALFQAEPCEGADPVCDRHGPELDADVVDAVAFYTRTLGVPARRSLNDPLALRGELRFHAAGCSDCHVATLRTGVLPGVPEVADQTIHPYTDLLVHDMGAGLADNRPDFQAGGSEWRTAPLWGIGLVPTVNQHSNFLHDGRARSLVEAILWHGGEAAAARERFRRMSATDRSALVAFLSSL